MPTEVPPSKPESEATPNGERLSVVLAIPPALMPSYCHLRSTFKLTDDELANNAIHFIIHLHQQGLVARSESLQASLTNQVVGLEVVRQRAQMAIAAATEAMHANRAILAKIESHVSGRIKG